MSLKKFIATTIQEYFDLNENANNFQLKTLLNLSNDIENYITCDVVGSCVHFAEEFVEKAKSLDESLLKLFNVVNIKVRLFDKNAGSYWGDHTYIELFDGTIIDPTIKQFRGGKYDKVDSQTKKYRGDEYYNKFMEDGSFFKTIRHRYMK